MFNKIIPWKNKNKEVKKYDDRFSDFHKHFDNFFSSFLDDYETPFSSLPSLWGDSGKSWFNTPKVDISENSKEIKISADVPGISEKDIRVNLDKDRLIIEGRSAEDNTDEKENYYYRERRSGFFRRVIPVESEIIDEEKIKASLKKGVLKISLPKNKNKVKEQKKIRINAA